MTALDKVANVATTAAFVENHGTKALLMFLAVWLFLHLFHNTTGTIQWGRGNRRKR